MIYLLVHKCKWKVYQHTKKKKAKVKSLSCVRLFATPWTVAYQAPPFMGFSRQEYWSGLPFPSLGDHFLLQGIFPTQGSNQGLPHSAQTLLSHQGSPHTKAKYK